MDYEKKYKEALKRASGFKTQEYKDVAAHIFPKLTESEDEKIRKALIQNLKERFGTKGTMGKGLNMPDVIAWLEKQEQKQEWSDEEEIKETIRCSLLSCCKGSLLNYVLPYDGYGKCLSWLKSLRPQWKPSDEQINELGKYCPDNTILTSLYEQLKKLKE